VAARLYERLYDRLDAEGDAFVQERDSKLTGTIDID
jgi:hypothetical protein